MFLGSIIVRNKYDVKIRPYFSKNKKLEKAEKILTPIFQFTFNNCHACEKYMTKFLEND